MMMGTQFVFSSILRFVPALVILALVVFGIIKAIQLIKKHHLFQNKKSLIVSVICIVVATASVIFNMGWIRFIMIFMLIPLIHPFLFLVTNLYASKFFKKASGLKLTNAIFVVSYLIFWIFLPDFSDYGPGYFLFNLVHNDKFSYIAFIIAYIAAVVHIVSFIIQIVRFIVIHKKAKKDSKSQ